LLVVCPVPLCAATIGLNFTGVTFSDGSKLNGGGYVPPDNAGAVGPDKVVQLINGAFAVYDKSTGSPYPLISGRQFWINAGFIPPEIGPGLTNLGVFNQRILYDPTAGRWIAAALTGESTDNNVLLARSTTSDPRGEWKAVNFLGNAGGSGKFVDFTRLGVDANGVYLSTTNFTDNTPQGGLDSLSVFSVPKADLMASTPTLDNMTRFDALNTSEFFVGLALQPITNFGPVGNHAPLLGTTPEATDTFLFRTDLMNTAAAGATMTQEAALINVNAYTLPPKAAQPDPQIPPTTNGTRTIGLIDHRFKSNVTQVGNVIYAAHDVKEGNNAAIHWYKIDETTNQVIQQGVLSDPNYDYYQASIAANANGDVVISFNRSGFGADGKISIYAVVGTSIGDTTTFGAPLLLKASNVNNYNLGNYRWGDYTTTVVDPTNPNVFWTFQEYAQASNAWATQVTQIFVPEPASMALAVVALVAFAAAAWRQRSRLAGRS